MLFIMKTFFRLIGNFVIYNKNVFRLIENFVISKRSVFLIIQKLGTVIFSVINIYIFKGAATLVAAEF